MASGTAGTGGTQSGSPASDGAGLKGGGATNGVGGSCTTQTHTEYRASPTFAAHILRQSSG